MNLRSMAGTKLIMTSNRRNNVLRLRQTSCMNIVSGEDFMVVL